MSRSPAKTPTYPKSADDFVSKPVSVRAALDIPVGLWLPGDFQVIAGEERENESQYGDSGCARMTNWGGNDELAANDYRVSSGSLTWGGFVGICAGSSASGLLAIRHLGLRPRLVCRRAFGPECKDRQSLPVLTG